MGGWGEGGGLEVELRFYIYVWTGLKEDLTYNLEGSVLCISEDLYQKC